MKRLFIPTWFAVLLVGMLAFVACDEDEEDDGLNGWSDDGCNLGREAADGGKRGVTTEIYSFDSCVPELPDGDFREPLEAIFDRYLGTYVDNEGKTREIVCRPDGAWELPFHAENARCMPNWGIPVAVRLEEQDGEAIAAMQLNEPPFRDDGRSNGGTLGYWIGDDGHDAEEACDRYPDMVWEFVYPEDQVGIEWTKVSD